MAYGTDGFPITPSDTDNLINDPGNTEKYLHCFIHNKGADGIVKILNLNGHEEEIYIVQGEISAVRAMKVFATPVPPTPLEAIIDTLKAKEPFILVDIDAPMPINKPKGTQFNDLGLPATVTQVTLDDGSTIADVPVTWLYGKYDPSVAGACVIEGRVALPPIAFNPRNIGTTITVTLA